MSRGNHAEAVRSSSNRSLGRSVDEGGIRWLLPAGEDEGDQGEDVIGSIIRDRGSGTRLDPGRKENARHDRPDQPARDREAPQETGPRHRPGMRSVWRGRVGDPSEAWNFSWSGGPGGNVNKTSTWAELRVPIRAIGGSNRMRSNARGNEPDTSCSSRGRDQVVSDEHRSQRRNREACLERLSALVGACERRPRVRRKTRPTRASKERRLKDKKQHSRKKQDRNWRDDG